MSQGAVETFLGRIITDKRFCAQATVSLECACTSAGLSLSLNELSYLKAIDLREFARVAKQVDGALRRS